LTPDVEARISEAFKSLHDLGVVHGDIHPRHVLVLRDGSIRVLDFDHSFVVSSIDCGGVEFEDEEIENMFNGLKGYKYRAWDD
jgi:RIO-like serine/threonine protein kinase